MLVRFSTLTRRSVRYFSDRDPFPFGVSYFHCCVLTSFDLRKSSDLARNVPSGVVYQRAHDRATDVLH